MKSNWTMAVIAAGMALAGTVSRAQPAEAKNQATTQYTERFVTVAPGVRLQVLDWGGNGRPVILLAGLGFDAHEFDSFAPRLTPRYHIYAITRRGFGESSAPAPEDDNYSATRLADDVLAVMSALNIRHPVLVGHSIAGEELSSIGTRYPDRVAGLVYLDAGYAYVYYGKYAPAAGWMFDGPALIQELRALTTPSGLQEKQAEVARLVNVQMPRVTEDLAQLQKQMKTNPPGVFEMKITPQIQIDAAIIRGFRIYDGVRCPALAIFADPHAAPPQIARDAAKAAAWEQHDEEGTTRFVVAFQKGNPAAKVVKIAGASHLIFRSNPNEVLREMNAFIASLH